MRISKRESVQKNYSILTLDDDPIMTSTLQAFFQRSGYRVDVENDPLRAIDRIREGNYDILLLDFLMSPLCGDQVVAEVRKFNKDIFIILLTGHKSVAPPIKTIRDLDIQAYFEKSDHFDQLELLVESCVKSIKQMRTIKNYRNGLSAIVDSLPRIYQARELEPMMDSIAASAAGFMEARGVSLEVDAGLDNGKPGSVVRTTGDISDAPSMGALFESGAFDDAPVIFRDPLTIAAVYAASGDPLGVVCANTGTRPRDDRMQLMDVYARQISSALENYALHAKVRAKNDELIQAYAQLKDGYMEVINALRLMVDARDIYTSGHSDRVSAIAEAIAGAMGKDEEYRNHVRIAGLFHDIGKVGIPDSILHKASCLTDDEYTVIKKHPSDGARILTAISLFREMVPWVRSHHEKWDGSGYPDGLSGKNIPEGARIIAVADAFDAMTSNRAYRKSLSFETTTQRLIEGSNVQFDPEVVEAFLRIAHQFQ